MAEEKLIPELRFPEFEGEWNEKNLGQICTWSSGGTPSKENVSYWNGDIPWISASTMLGDVYYDSNRKLTLEGLKNGSRLAKKGSILLLVRGSMLYNKVPVGIAGVDLAFNQDVKALEVISNVSSRFLFELFHAIQHRLLNMVVGTGIGAGKLDTEDLKGLKIFIPSPPEQQKIATFLTAVDQRIQQLRQKKAKLEAYKKGVMQRLFAPPPLSESGLPGLEDEQDGSGREDHPVIPLSSSSRRSAARFRQLRFKDENGDDFPDWEEKKLGEIYSFKTTNSFSRENLNYERGQVRNIHYGDIHTKFKTHFDITDEVVPFVNTEVDISRISDENYAQEGDLVIADASEDYADIGKAIELINLNEEKVLAGLHTFLARRTNGEMTIGFGGHLMKSQDVRLKIMRIAQGTKVLGLSYKRLAEISLRLPHLEEQEKIASFLSSIDTAIEKVGQQIDDSVVFKKGLLQKMFV